LFDLILNFLQNTFVVFFNKTPLDACLYFIIVFKGKAAIVLVNFHPLAKAFYQSHQARSPHLIVTMVKSSCEW
jgi:hypothetical protein